jgi:hypothetical protein
MNVAVQRGGLQGKGMGWPAAMHHMDQVIYILLAGYPLAIAHLLFPTLQCKREQRVDILPAIQGQWALL